MSTPLTKRTLEIQIFKVAVIICIVTAFLLFLRDVFIDKDYVSGIIEFIALLLCILAYWFSQSAGIYRVINIFIPTTFLLLNLGWYFGSGLNSTIVLLYISIISLSIIVFPDKYRSWLIGGYFINITILIIFEFFNPDIRIQVGNSPKELIASDTSIAITFFMGISLIRYIRKKYEKAREESVLRNQQLDEQAADLIEINKELSLLNNNLEELVEERTKQINIQNRKLLEYAYLNSSSVKKHMGYLKEAINVKADAELEKSLPEIKITSELLDMELKNINEQLKD